MLSLRIIAAVLVFLISRGVPLAAQSPGDLPVDARFTATPLAEALRQLDRQLPLQLVFSPADLPDKSITASYEQEPFDGVLKDLLRGTAFSFFYYRDYAVVIGRHDFVESAFTAEYYRTLENVRSAEATPERSGEPTVGSLRTLDPSGQARIRGVVRDAATGDPVAGATVYWPATEQGANTDEQGRFSLSLPAGRQPVQVQYIGYATLDRTINVLGSGQLELELVEGATNLQEVLVSAAGGAEANVSDVRIGVTRLDIRSLEKLPSLLGEIDIVRAILLDPGVATIGEGAAGFNVRGGEVDQNLILQDGAVLFNATHALGFFSSFNPDIVGNVQLYKGNLPAQYGGRLASVLDVELREGYTALMYNGKTQLNYPGPPLFLIDGKATRNATFVGRLDPSRIERVELYYDADVLGEHFPAFGNNGLVVIHTIAGDGMAPEEQETDIIPVNGLLPVAAFPAPAPGLPNFRPQVFWAPDIACGTDGRARFTFTPSDDLSTFTIEVVAHAADGRTGRTSYTYTVSGSPGGEGGGGQR